MYILYIKLHIMKIVKNSKGLIISTEDIERGSNCFLYLVELINHNATHC